MAITFAPSLTKTLAAEKPIPEVPPTMTIFLLANSMLFQKHFTHIKMQCNNHFLKVKSIKL